jgi:hypothetical protein
MTATLSYVEHVKDIRSKAKQTMQSKFFRHVDSTDLQTSTSLGTPVQLASGSCRIKEKGRNMRRNYRQPTHGSR